MFKKIILAVLVLSSAAFIAFVEYPGNLVEEPKELPHMVKEYDPVLVLELFTSQGCSSCPAADRLLNELKKTSDPTIITLSYHVDYWNYIGWKDPFSSSTYTRKQQLYNHKFKSRSNYTPQVVVNGKDHFVGSNKGKLRAHIASYKKLPAMNKLAILNAKKNANKVFFEYQVDGEIEQKDIKAILVLDERTTHVKRGENSNRTLINSNIVIAEKIENLTSNGGKLSIEIPKEIGIKETLRLVLLVENDTYDITGAIQLVL